MMTASDYVVFLTANIPGASAKEHLRPVLSTALEQLDVDEQAIQTALDAFFKRTLQ